MAVEYVRPVSRFALWSRRAAIFALVLSIGSWAAIRFGPLLEPHFIALYGLSVGLAVFAIFCGVIGLTSLWRTGAKGGMASVMAILLSLPVLVPGAYAFWLYKKRPVIYEVSTDLIDPPNWIKQPVYDQLWLGFRPAPDASTREAQYSAYPALIAHRYDGAIDRVLAGTRKVLAATGMKVSFEKLPDLVEKSAAPADGASPIPIPTLRPSVEEQALPPPPPVEARIQGEVSGSITGFRYDFMIRLKEDSETTLADIRVTSRFGRTDLGGSARIAADFLKVLDVELTGSSE